MKKQEIFAAINMLQAAQEGNGTSVMFGKKVKRKVMYIAGLGANLASKNGHIIDQATQKLVGTTNFDGGNKLNTGRSLLVTGIRILFDTTSGVTIATAVWKGEAPAVFKNGEFKISQDGTGDLLENPIGPFAKYGSSIPTEVEFAAVVPFIIRPDAPFYIQLLTAGAAGADQAFRIELDCVEFVESDKAA